MAVAPAVAPLWAMGVAMAMAFAQWCPGPPGMFEGNRSVTVGRTQVMSPMSSEPPPILLSSGSGSSRLPSSIFRPSSLPPLRRLVADLEELLDVGLVELAEVVPDGSLGRHDVRLVAAVGDHVMHALRGPPARGAE